MWNTIFVYTQYDIKSTRFALVIVGRLLERSLVTPFFIKVNSSKYKKYDHIQKDKLITFEF